MGTPDQPADMIPKLPPKCRLCGDTILFHKTVNGKAMPLDPGANPEGNVVIIDDIAVVLGKEDPRRTSGQHILLMPHWATCRNLNRGKKGNQ